MIELVANADGQPGRVEVPFTADHWEVAFIASEVPIARGWERQVDMDRNAVLYEEDMTAAEYRRWIDDNAVRWIALPDVELDKGGEAEAALLERGVDWLRLVRTTDHWRIWEVVDAEPIVEAPGRLVRESPDEIVISVERPGTVLRPGVVHAVLVRGGGRCVRRGLRRRPARGGRQPARVGASATRVLPRPAADRRRVG